ncbi:MAG: hypothetical protein MR609_05130 [Bacteroidales bacterium]|nr:hypothetical protein [Bacteroidales bacterium]
MPLTGRNVIRILYGHRTNAPIGVGGTECQILVDHGRETIGLAAVGEKGTIHFLGSVGAE